MWWTHRVWRHPIMAKSLSVNASKHFREAQKTYFRTVVYSHLASNNENIRRALKITPILAANVCDNYRKDRWGERGYWLVCKMISNEIPMTTQILTAHRIRQCRLHSFAIFPLNILTDFLQVFIKGTQSLLLAGRDSSVGPGIESRRGGDSPYPSRPALESPPRLWVTRFLSRE